MALSLIAYVHIAIGPLASTTVNQCRKRSALGEADEEREQVVITTVLHSVDFDDVDRYAGNTSARGDHDSCSMRVR
ncbi:hypothetical protein ACF07T_11340 [Streptomyces sp. NPDC015184]|uniref:hypothetical protein n=1 Tax=Streptomyces sp. NPDC015184 TaxID=3364946 RepID=UPI0036FE0A8D